MNSLQQRFRPKHQVLVLKCYPRTTKGAVDVKPNSSELSYLLFYATSRRSKIQKIGAYLEKKTAHDVSRLRIGNVQVTLGILTALVEKSPKDLPLIAPCILKILEEILKSNDITMIESSLPTWEAFCEHHDPSSLFGDQAYLKQYEAIVSGFAKLASTRFVPKGGSATSLPVKMRWRNAGLTAIKSMAAADALASVAGRQTDIVVPMVLENLWTDNDDFLDVLLQRTETEEKADTEKPLKRRMSTATVRTTDTAGDANPAAISGTAGDADKLAEEETGVRAMHCLKSIFEMPNRSQIHASTHAFFKFIFERLDQGDNAVHRTPAGQPDGGWAVNMFNIISRWAPVQDRFVVLVVAMDVLNNTPMKEGTLDKHITVIAMICSLLHSDVNLIGLSVMDVLLGLIKQIKKVFRMPGDGSRSESPTDEKAVIPDEDSSSPRRDLLHSIELAIGDLATHVYYAEQISDMIGAIMMRVKPARSSSNISTPQGEKADGQDNGVNASLADLSESQSSGDTSFSYNEGRVSALRAVRAILLVANPKTKVAGNMDLSRNRVPVHVWEGTQWLLRDPSGHVRKAYVKALVTWLDRETTSVDLRAQDETQHHQRGSLKNSRELPTISPARRAVSNASNRDRPVKGRKSQFLALLHLAIYDNALQYVEYDNDVAVLHVLLTKLVYKLGVNAARYGIPMVFRLQEEIQEVDMPVHKVRVAALCHGYFWALMEKFDFDASVVGRAIHNEISRRRSKGFWVEGVNVPAPSVDQAGTPGQPRPQQHWDLEALEKEELLPFDDRTALVECVATAYEESALSPPASPVASPLRTPNAPVLGSTISTEHHGGPESELPSPFRDQMLTEWSREGFMESLAAEAREGSVAGSKSATLATTRNRLALNTTGVNGNGHLPASPYGSQYNLRPLTAQPQTDRLGTASKLRKTSAHSGVSPSATAHNKAGIASVEQLKLVLSGDASPTAMRFSIAATDDDASSIDSYEYAPSELSYLPGDVPLPGGDHLKRSESVTRAIPDVQEDGEHHPEATDDGVPPVPPLPASASVLSKISTAVGGDVAAQDFAGSGSPSTKAPRRNLSSRGKAESLLSRRSMRSTREDGVKGTVDLQDLLRGIDSRSGEGSLGNLTKPPY